MLVTPCAAYPRGSLPLYFHFRKKLLFFSKIIHKLYSLAPPQSPFSYAYTGATERGVDGGSSKALYFVVNPVQHDNYVPTAAMEETISEAMAQSRQSNYCMGGARSTHLNP